VGVYIADITPSEKAARFLSHPLWRVLFVILGLISIFIELKSPGHGAGYLGFALCMGVFFWLQMFVANAGIFELILFGAGATLVALEIFLFPGVGVLGFAGFVLLIASIILSFLPEGISITNVWSGNAQPWEAEMLNKGLMWSAVTLLSIVTVVIVGLLKGATLPGLSRMALTTQVGGTVNSGRLANAATDAASGPKAALNALVGQSGTAETVLRPAGKVRLNGVTYEAVSEGGFLKPGVNVTVLRVSANSLVVRETT
jgi:membrane-bound serine protease (ClpP class)